MEEPTPEEIAELAAHEWRREEFAPIDSIRISADGRRKRVKDGWDHEHCTVCWATICDRGPEDLRVGYVGQNDQWLCQACFARYVTANRATA